MADCARSCQTSGGEAAARGDESAAGIVSASLDCLALCGSTEALLARRSSFDVRMLSLAVQAAAT